MKKQRDMNFELLRIVSMILIISSHYILHGGILKYLELYSFNYFFIDVIRALTRISVNLYVLITGYYMINSKIKIKKLFNLWLIVIFYSIGMFILSTFVGVKPGFQNITRSIMPISSGLYWFPTTYVALYILVPFINILVKKMNQKQYKILLGILFILLVLMKNIFNTNGYIDAKNGSSLIWFVYLYLIAGYIRLYYTKSVNKTICLVITLITPFIITLIRAISLRTMDNNMNKLLDFSNILNFISSIGLFLCFREIKIKNKIINKCTEKLSPLMFGIYLIHENPYFKGHMWKKMIGVYKYATSSKLVIHFIVSVVGVFCICAIIEYIRMKLFDLGKHTKICKKIDEKLDAINDKFWNIMEEETCQLTQ